MSKIKMGGGEPQATSAINNSDVKENGSTDSKVTKDVSTSEINDKETESSKKKVQSVDSLAPYNKEGQKTSVEKKADSQSTLVTETQRSQKQGSTLADSKETTALNREAMQPVAKSALKESKIAEAAKQVTATLNIYDYDANDPKTPDVNGGEGIAFTYTGKFNEGSIKDAIEAQFDADTQKQLAYKDQGTAIVPDKDGLPTEIGVSPVIYGDFTDADIGGYNYRDVTTATYTKDQQAKLVADYNKWLDYKKAHFALAGYKLADQDEQAINLDDPIEDGKTYNIYVNHQISVVNVYHWTELKRTVEFKYYYKQDDKDTTAADSITKNGYYNDGKYNSTQTTFEKMTDNSNNPQFSNLPSTVDCTKISDANSFETRLLPDDLKTSKDQNKVIYDTIYGRYVDLALGLITDKNGNLNNYPTAIMDQPSGTVLFEGEPVKQIDNWHTFDPDVPDTGSEDINDPDTYSTANGDINKGTGRGIERVDNPATTTIYYYHDQPVDITFEDVTNGDANASVLSNFTASNQLRVDLNSEYIPGKPHNTPRDKKNNKNKNYEKYSYQASDNTYNVDTINVDPKNTLKASSSLNYADILKAYTDNGYALVSSDPDNLTYELEDVYDNNRNLQHKKRVVKLVHRAVAHTDTKNATRTIHYVANTKDGKQLRDDTTQNVTLTSSTYYTDAVTGNRVNAKQDANGDWIVDTTNTDPIPALTWTVDIAKSNGVSDNTQDFAAVTTPDTINLTSQEAATRKVDDGDWYLVDTDSNGQVSYGDPNSDTWKTDTPKKVSDGYLIYKQKAQYSIHYIDVNGIEDKNEYKSGTNLGHDVTNVGSAEGTYVGDTPDVTGNLWKSAHYEKAGYVLVGMSENAEGGKLGHQILTHGVQDQYIYLKHAVVEITPETPDSDIPSDPADSTKPSVDKSTLSKTFTRTIYYKANIIDGATLKDATTQKVTFEGSIFVDKVTHKTTTPTTIKVNGENVQVATTNTGSITWNKVIVDDGTPQSGNSATLSAIDQPTITLNSGDRYATSDSMIGTWKLVSGKADAIDLTPSSSNPKDVQLVYEKEVQSGGNTGGQPSGEPSDNPGNEPSGQPGDKGSKTPGKPDENKPDEPKKDNTKKPEEKKPSKKTPQKKNPSKKSTKKSPTKSNKTKQTKQSKKSPKPVKKAVNKTSNNAPRAENMYRNNVPTPENDNVTMPKSEVIDQTSGKPVGLVDNTAVGANGENTLPQTDEKQSDAAAFGLIALAFAGLASFVGVDRKKRNN